MYFIDVLALRAGHEKDEDEADTVGCCTLKARRAVLSRLYLNLYLGSVMQALNVFGRDKGRDNW